MKMLAVLTALVPLCLAAPRAFADCTNTNSPFDGVYCDIQVFHQADHQLNEDYKSLHTMLNASQKHSLKESEIAWIQDRNSQCTAVEGKWSYVSIDCAIDMTTKRDDLIKQLARECSSTGCVDSDIAKEFE